MIRHRALSTSGGVFLFGGVAALCAAVACSGAQESDSARIGTQTSTIIAGKNSDESQNAVILLMTASSQGVGGCTGTLVAPNLILTARHCIAETASAPFACNADGTLVTGSMGGTVSKDRAAGDLYVFTGPTRPTFGRGTKPAAKGKTIFNDQAKVLCGHDIALVLLDQAITDMPIASLRLDAPTERGESLTAVGWGVTETTPYPGTRQQRAGVKVIKIGPFDGQFAEPSIPANDFMVGEAICQGDSGGPAFSETTGAVVGVVSRGGNGSSDPQNPSAGCISAKNQYTRVSAFKELILSAFEAAGAEPWYEGGPDPRKAKFGEVCEGSDACRSDLCYDEGDGQPKCTQSCVQDDCPEGYACEERDGAKLCVTSTDSGNADDGGVFGCSTAPAPSTRASAWLGTALAIALGAALSRRRKR